MKITKSQAMLQRGARLIERLDVVSGRATSSYDHTKQEQQEALRRAVEEGRKVDKSILLAQAALMGASEAFISEVLFQEFREGSKEGNIIIPDAETWYEGDMQKRAVQMCLMQLKITSALRLFIRVAENRVNNQRTRTAIRWYLFGRLSESVAVKYRRKLHRILRHIYGTSYRQLVASASQASLGTEMNPAWFDEHVMPYTDKSRSEVADMLAFIVSPYQPDTDGAIGAFRKAKHASSKAEFKAAIKQLDITVVMGLINYDNPWFKQMFGEDGKLKDEWNKFITEHAGQSDTKKLRDTERRKSLGLAKAKVDYSKVDQAAVYKTENQAGEDMSEARRALAESNKVELPFRSIAIVADRSISNQGGVDSAGTNDALIRQLEDTLLASAPTGQVIETLVAHTYLAGPFIEAAEAGPDAIFILSDGYENYPFDGCLSGVISQMRSRGWDTPVFHISPMTSAEHQAKARSLGEGIVSFTAGSPAALRAQFEAKLLHFNPQRYFEKLYKKLEA